MLSLAELRRAARVLDDAVAGARLQRLVQPDEHSLVLTFYGIKGEMQVLLCCRPGFARLSTLSEGRPAPPAPPPLAQYLRARLRAARCTHVGLVGDDRLVTLRFESAEGTFELLLSLLGPRSNVYVLDANAAVVASLRPLAETRRDLALGRPWSNPASAPPLEGEDRWADVSDEEYLAAIDRTYGVLEAESACDDLRRQLSQALQKEIAFLVRRAAKLEVDLASATAATESRRLGELLKNVLHSVRPGAVRAVATDYETGQEVVIPLDPELSAADNLKRLFARYQKAQKATEALAGQLDATRARRSQVERLQQDLAACGLTPSLAELRAFAARPEVRDVLARHGARRAAGRRDPARPAPSKRPSRESKVPARLRPKVYYTEDGLEIWVGRSDEGNDYITTRLARGNDLFFHVEGGPGSHVILRTGGRKDPPPGSILDACELAVHFSKGRGAVRADVHVAAINDVKKPPRAKPGLVYLLRSKTVHLRRDRTRLARVLASRAEE
jgi:predicted ribosome quality control (RQC) complex YloA/Tae2 family protein